MDIVTKSRETVEELLARCSTVKTYEQRCQYALDVVDMHLHEENPERIDECLKLYTDDAVWEAPARGVTYVGRAKIREMYLRLFRSGEGIQFEPIERFASPDRVFDDMWVRFRLVGDRVRKLPIPDRHQSEDAPAAQFPHSRRHDRQGNRLRGLVARRMIDRDPSWR